MSTDQLTKQEMTELAFQAYLEANGAIVVWEHEQSAHGQVWLADAPKALATVERKERRRRDGRGSYMVIEVTTAQVVARPVHVSTTVRLVVHSDKFFTTAVLDQYRSQGWQVIRTEPLDERQNASLLELVQQVVP